MLKSNAIAIWLFSNICQPKIKRKAIWIRRRKSYKRFFTETKTLEIKIAIKSSYLVNKYSNGKGIKSKLDKNEKDNKNENKKERWG